MSWRPETFHHASELPRSRASIMMLPPRQDIDICRHNPLPCCFVSCSSYLLLHWSPPHQRCYFSMYSKIDKKEATVTETSVSGQARLDVEEAGSIGPNRNVKAAVYAIVCGVALPCVPIIAISGVLLGVIFQHQIVPVDGWPALHIESTSKPPLSALGLLSEIRHHGGTWAYYTVHNPSTITTIASWTGRLIPYLSSSIMALVAKFKTWRWYRPSYAGAIHSSYRPTWR